MDHINEGLRGLSVIMTLNLDRLLIVGVLCAALAAGAYVSHP